MSNPTSMPIPGRGKLMNLRGMWAMRRACEFPFPASFILVRGVVIKHHKTRSVLHCSEFTNWCKKYANIIVPNLRKSITEDMKVIDAIIKHGEEYYE